MQPRRLQAGDMPRTGLVRLAVTGTVLALVASACASPTLPLPPPSVNLLTYSDGEVFVEGTAIPGAMVFAYNRDLGEGVISRADESDGAFSMVLPGEPTQIIVVWQQDGDDRSAIWELPVPSPAG